MSNQIVSRDQWLEARRELLAQEKSATQQLAEVARLRRELPRVRVEQDYRFESDDGTVTLLDLFGKNRQLLIYHFMFGPGAEQGCVGCSFLADHIDGVNLHLPHHDVSFATVSRAPLADFRSFRERMGWKFPWVSSAGNDFNYDFGVSFTPEQIEQGTADYNYQQTGQVGAEMPGLSVFTRDDQGSVYHTYSTYARGLDMLLGTHSFLDLTPLGRNEQGTMNWVRHHDKYDDADATTIGPGDR